jgi:hypothetical protein
MYHYFCYVLQTAKFFTINTVITESLSFQASLLGFCQQEALVSEDRCGVKEEGITTVLALN